MQLPNKLYSYKNSTLALVPAVLQELKSGSISVNELYRRIRPLLDDPTDFMSVMVCVYALQAVDMDDEGEVFLCLSK